jgi:hypothetical protein
MNKIISYIDGHKVIEYRSLSIFIVENIISDSCCDKLVELIKSVPLNKKHYEDKNNVLCHITTVNELVNIDDNFYYEFSTDSNFYENMMQKISKKNNISTNRINGFSNKEINNFKKTIDNIFVKLDSVMSNVNCKINFKVNSGYVLRKIYGPTRLHTDGIVDLNLRFSELVFINEPEVKGQPQFIRKASIVFTLNDDYDGGMFNFPYYDITVKLKKGSVIIFEGIER